MQTKQLLDICSVLTSVIKVNPIKPITELVEFYAKDGIMHIGMTDGLMRIVATSPTDADMPNVVVNAARLCNLLKYTTKNELTLKYMGDHVLFRGNGKYKLGIVLDESGNEIQLRLSMPKLAENPTTGNPADYQMLLKRNKITLATDDSMIMLQRYGYIDGLVVTTNSLVVGATKMDAMCYEQMYAVLVYQLAQLPDTFTWSVSQQGLRIHCNNFELFSMISAPTDFPFPIVSTVLHSDIDCKISVEQKDFVDAVKRLTLFKDSIGTPALFISVMQNKFMVSNLSAQEDVPCTIDKLNEEIHMKFNADTVLNIVKKMEKETLVCEINSMFMKFTDSIGSYIIGRLEDEQN